VDPESGDVIPLHDRNIYKENWIGMRDLGQRGGLIFRTVEGLHMQIPDDLIMEVAREFLGSSKTLGHSGEQQIVIQNGFS
jgi:palmitoyl-protein thioesterase